MKSLLSGFFSGFETLVSAFRNASSQKEEAEIAKTQISILKEALNVENDDNHHTNVMKVIYLHMLGYPVQFAQMRCIKLMGSSKFINKKVGYLACSMLIDENSDLHTLVVHTINTDIISEDPYIQAMALSAFACIISERLAISSVNQILKAIMSNHPFVASKAAICASKVIEKNPDSCAAFIPAFTEKIKSTDAAMKISFCCLGMSIVDHGMDLFDEFWVETSRILIRMLQEKSSNHRPSLELANRSIQIRAIKLLCAIQLKKGQVIQDFTQILCGFIGVNLKTSSEGVRDISIYAIPMEAIKALIQLGIDGEVLFIVKETLNKLLKTESKNVRLVALKTYKNFVQAYPEHCDFEALKEFFTEGEIYPIRLTLESIFYGLAAKIDCEIVNMLIDLLDIFDLSLRQFVVDSLISSIVSFPVNYQKWKVDSFIRLLSLTGKYSNEEILPRCIAMVMACEDQLKIEFIHRIYSFALKCPSNNFLIQLTCWTIGEIGYALMAPCPFVVMEPGIDPRRILEFLHQTIISGSISQSTKYFSLNALVKILIHDSNLKILVIEMLKKYQHHVDIEIQTRSIEYTLIIELCPDTLSEIFPKYIPPPTLINDYTKSSQQPKDSLDFLSSFGMGSSTNQSNDNFFDSIFGMGGSSTDISSKSEPVPADFSSTSNIQTTSTAEMNEHSIIVIECVDYQFYITPQKVTNDGSLNIMSVIQPIMGHTMQNVQLKVAPSKDSIIQMIKITESEISGLKTPTINQLLIKHQNNIPLKLKFVISYKNSFNKDIENIKILEISPAQYHVL